MYLQHCKCTNQIHGEGPQILIISYSTAAANSCYSLITRLRELWALFVVNFAQENWVFTTILAEMLIITIMIKWWGLETAAGMNLETEGRRLVWLYRKMCCGKSGLWLCHLLRTTGWIGAQASPHAPLLGHEGTLQALDDMGWLYCSTRPLLWLWGRLEMRGWKISPGVAKRKKLREQCIVQIRKLRLGDKNDSPKVIQVVNERWLRLLAPGPRLSLLCLK